MCVCHHIYAVCVNHFLCVYVCVCALLDPGVLCRCSPTLVKMMNLGILCSETTELAALSLAS